MPAHIVKYVLYINAASFCDTVSSSAGIEKTKLVKMVDKQPDTVLDADVFYDTNPDIDKLEEVGTQVCHTRALELDSLENLISRSKISRGAIGINY